MTQISGLGLRNNANASLLQAKAAKNDEVKSANDKGAEDTAAKKAVEQNVDKFVKSTDTNLGAYSKNTAYKPSANELMAMARQRTQSFQNMLQSMLVQQGQKGNTALFGAQLNVSQSDVNSAKAAIADGGAYSVDAVAGRIMDMAKALSGGDSSKIDLLRDAVQKGFEAAGVEMGGSLPDISNNTYNEVMNRFDAWANESRAASGMEEAG